MTLQSLLRLLSPDPVGPGRVGGYNMSLVLLFAQTVHPHLQPGRMQPSNRRTAVTVGLTITAPEFARTSLHQWRNFLHHGGFLFRRPSWPLLNELGSGADGVITILTDPVEKRKDGGEPESSVLRSLLALVHLL